MSAPVRHILVVEDDFGVRGTLADVIEDAGYRVSLAANGAEMRRILAAGEAVDVVILDLLLPGEPGAALAASLRDLGVPAILISASHEAVLQAQAEGFEPIEKPFRMRQLLDAIDRVFTTGA